MGDCASDVRLMGHVQLLWDKIWSVGHTQLKEPYFRLVADKHHTKHTNAPTPPTEAEQTHTVSGCLS